MIQARAVSFDFGQTLAELDTVMLARRLRERDVAVAVPTLDAAVPGAWAAYNQAIRAGQGGHPWSVLMRTLLAEAKVSAERLEGTVAWLWNQQPVNNLWRRPIPGMIELVRDLRAAGVPVGVVSNSEGRLAELADELGWGALFDVLVDSGRFGIEKPDPRIFWHAVQALGHAPEAVVHIGDAWAADFEGALGAGLRAVLFRGGSSVPTDAEMPSPERACRCEEAMGVREALRTWGIAVGS